LKRLTYEEQRELIRYGTLAPSAFNSQPWKFLIGEKGLSLYPDFARQLSVSDPENQKSALFYFAL
jgi:hypothetical protein